MSIIHGVANATMGCVGGGRTGLTRLKDQAHGSGP